MLMSSKSGFLEEPTTFMTYTIKDKSKKQISLMIGELNYITSTLIYQYLSHNSLYK